MMTSDLREAAERLATFMKEQGEAYHCRHVTDRAVADLMRMANWGPLSADLRERTIPDGIDLVYDAIITKFGQRVTLPSLWMIAGSVASYAGIDPPNRSDRRHKQTMLAWFRSHWHQIGILIPFVELREFPQPCPDKIRQAQAMTEQEESE
jgi:hypothetical protein